MQRTESRQRKWAAVTADCRAAWRPCSPTRISPSRTCRQKLWSVHGYARRRQDSPTSPSTSWPVCQVPDDWKEKFDWMVAENVIHDLPHPLKALEGISKALKPGGHFCLVDEFVSTYVAENLNNPGVSCPVCPGYLDVYPRELPAARFGGPGCLLGRGEGSRNSWASLGLTCWVWRDQKWRTCVLWQSVCVKKPA